MTPHTNHDTGNLFGIVSVGAGLMTWMDNHSNALGVIVAATSALAYVVFMTLNFIGERRKVKSKESIRRDVIAELLDKASQKEKDVIMKVAEK